MPETVLSTFIDIMLLILTINLRDIISILQMLNHFLRVTRLWSPVSFIHVILLSSEKHVLCNKLLSISQLGCVDLIWILIKINYNNSYEIFDNIKLIFLVCSSIVDMS